MVIDPESGTAPTPRAMRALCALVELHVSFASPPRATLFGTTEITQLAVVLSGALHPFCSQPNWQLRTAWSTHCVSRMYCVLLPHTVPAAQLPGANGVVLPGAGVVAGRGRTFAGVALGAPLGTPPGDG